MGWSKRKEPFPPQTAHKPFTVDAEADAAVETIDVMPTIEPAVMTEDRTSAAAIGATLNIQGELTGHEDVTIDGSLEGRIELLEHTLTIGPSASIKASIRARCVIIEGHVVGDITADDKVEVMATGSLVGDVRAARVVLAENARFKGNIDMGASEPAPQPKIRAQPAAPRQPVREERSPPVRPAAPAAAATARGNSLSALDWDEPAPPPPDTSPKTDPS
jgi:cytoskeletal protein CcmA (bactofilin family)